MSKLPSTTTAKTVNFVFGSFFTTPNAVSLKRWCELTIFYLLCLPSCLTHASPRLLHPSSVSSGVSRNLIWSLWGKGGRSILLSGAQHTSFPVSAGQVSAGGEAAAMQREGESNRERKTVAGERGGWEREASAWQPSEWASERHSPGECTSSRQKINSLQFTLSSW